MTYSGKRILILEDEPIIAMVLEDMLMDENAQVVLSYSVNEAFCAIERGSIDCAVLDVNLHGEKSYPVAHRLQELDVPFVFATGYGSAQHPESLAQIPTVTKPYSLAQIKSVLKC